MDVKITLLDLGGFSVPITKLIETVSKGIGVLYEPTAKVRAAKADAKKIQILAEAQIEKDELKLRAFERLTHTETRRQLNIDKIVFGAAGFMPEEVEVKEVEEDWIVSFFQLCQDTAHPDMQQIWSRLLAGEVATPGAFNIRTLNAVKLLTPEDARLFTRLGTFVFIHSHGIPFYPHLKSTFFQYVRRNGISAAEEMHLQDIGLLSSVLTSFPELPSTLHYFSDEYEFCTNNIGFESSNKLRGFPLTKVGRELHSIAGASADHEYIRVLVDDGVIKPRSV